MRPLSAHLKARRQRNVEAVHRLGPLPLFYFLAEVENGADLDETLEAYARLPAEFIRDLGGDRFAPTVWVIEGGRQ